MSNKIYMTDYNTDEPVGTQNGIGSGIQKGASSLGAKNGGIYPISDDIQIDIGSEFGSISEDLGELGGLIEFVNKWTANFAGKMSVGQMDLKNMMDAPRWNKTAPIMLNFTIHLYTKSDAETDVFKPFIDIASYSILSLQGNMFQLPGFSLANSQNFRKDAKELTAEKKIALDSAKNRTKDSNKLLDIFIPGIVTISPAILMKATPTFSKETTESGYPLWCKLECQVSGAYPAHTGIFNKTMKKTRIVAEPELPTGK